MTSDSNSIEIMAPVGSMESLQGAIYGGAHSIYFGVGSLNMRRKSANGFDFADMKSIVLECERHNIKTYLTVNSIVFNRDIDELHATIDEAKKVGVTAIIASDISAILYARSVGVTVHISTQVNITNIDAVRFYAKYADVMVLARELNLEQVKEISETIKKEQISGPSGNIVRIEMFVHGALCMAVSGKCYLSLHEQNKSANRGGCTQSCRSAYDVKDKNTGTELTVDNELIMSPKDLCTVEFIDEVIDAGVSVLKIEGRARAADYVQTVCSVYGRAIEAVKTGTFTEKLGKVLKQELLTVFNRGFWDGYYLGQKMGEWSKQYGSLATKQKEYIGKCITYFGRVGVADFKMQSGSLTVGDTVMVISKLSGVLEWTIQEIRVDFEQADSTQKGDTCSLATPEPIKRGDMLYKVVGRELVTVQ